MLHNRTNVQKWTYDIFLNVFLIQRSNAFFQEFGILYVAHAVVEISLEPANHSLHIPHTLPFTVHLLLSCFQFLSQFGDVQF